MTEGGGAGKKLFIFLLLAVAIMGSLYYFDIAGMKGRMIGWKDGLFPKSAEAKVVTNPRVDGEEVKLLSRFDWCETSSIQVSDYPEDPVAQTILGWDEGSGCCLYAVDGWNCAQNKTGRLSYCLNAQINPTIKYLRIDGVLNNNLVLLQEFIDDYDKRFIENKPCNTEKY